MAIKCKGLIYFVNIFSPLIPNSVGVRKKKKNITYPCSLRTICGTEAGQHRQGGECRQKVLSSMFYLHLHCTAVIAQRITAADVRGEEWILLGWLWPCYLSLGYGTDAQTGVTLSPFDSCPGCLLYDCGMPEEGCLCFGLMFGWLGHNDGRLNTVRYLDTEHLMGIKLTLELCLLSPHISTVSRCGIWLKSQKKV